MATGMIVTSAKIMRCQVLTKHLTLPAFVIWLLSIWALEFCLERNRKTLMCSEREVKNGYTIHADDYSLILSLG